VILPDANLLLYAYDSTSPFHDKARIWLENCLSGSESVGLCPVVLFAFIRIGTHPRVFEKPMPIERAAGHVEDWLKRKVCRLVRLEHEDVTRALELLGHLGVGGDLTTDAQIAALAIRLDATIHSVDSDFLRFPGVRVINPLMASR
jgi:toxin-antitoxin system PIN domain toxin